MPKLAGRVVSREIKDYGKGKDAESKEVHFATVRVDGRAGLPSGKYSFAMTNEEVEGNEYGLGETCTIDVAQPQTRLNLNERSAARRESASKAH